MIAFGILLCFCALSQSLPIGNPSSDSVLIDYKADSHSRFEEGTPGKSVKGSYSWINEDKVYQVDYTADERGYQPRLTIKSVSEAERKPIAQQESVHVSELESKEEKPVKEAIAGAIVFEIPHNSFAQQDSVQLPDEEKKVTPEKEVGSDAIVLEIPVRDFAQQDSVQVPSLLNEPMKEVGDAFVFEIPLLPLAQQDSFSVPTLQNEEKKVTPGVEGGFDAIILDIPDFDESTPVVQKGIQASEQIVADAPLSNPVTLQVNSQSESGKIEQNILADKVVVKIPVASAPVVQEQDIVQVVPVAEEVKPDKLVVAQEVVVETQVQSDPVGQQFNSQAQLLSQNEPSEAEQEKVGDGEGFIIELPFESDVYGQEEGYSQDDSANPEVDTSDIHSITPFFNFQSQEPADDEIYTDDAIIIDAAGDPFASDGAQADGEEDWGQAESQDQASVYLNAMLQDYLNQFYGNSKEKVENKENQRSKIGDDLLKSYYAQKEEKVSRKDYDPAVADYQRMSAGWSNDNQHAISYDDLYQNFLHHLQIEKEDRARSKVSEDLEDQGETNEELQTAFRILMDLAGSYSQQLYTPKKQNSKFESGYQSYDYPTDEALMRELYYQLWLDAQQPVQQEPMYYAIYPDSSYYHR